MFMKLNLHFFTSNILVLIKELVTYRYIYNLIIALIQLTLVQLTSLF